MPSLPAFTLRDLWALDLWSFFRQAYFIAKPTWGVDQIPDLSGKVIIVTGGNAGIGKATAKALLEHNAKVYLGCRDKQKTEAIIEELYSSTGKRAIFLKLDLGDLKSVKACAEEFISKENDLHVLFNNAGVMSSPMEMLANGYDLQFHTNVLGHFYLTKLLLPVLLAGAKSSSDGKARVLTTSSSAHYFARAEALDFNAFKDGPARSKMSTDQMYAQSKFANIVFANELERRYGDQGIVSTSVNPGNIQTELNRHVDGSLKTFALGFLQTNAAETGALTQLWAGTSPEGVTLGGKYLIPWAKVGKARKDAEGLQLGRDLWTWLEEQVKDI